MKSSLSNQIIYNPTSGDLLGRLEDLTDAVQFIVSVVGWKREDEDSVNGKIQDFLAKTGQVGPGRRLAGPQAPPRSASVARYAAR